MVSTSDQYSQDASAIHALTEDFKKTSSHIFSSIQNMVRTIEEISTANNEGAEGTQTIANLVTSIMEKTIEVNELLKETEKSALILEEAISTFKI